MRQASSTIKGYLYQFIKTLDAILSTTQGEEIVIEGIIEDIDVNAINSTTTIQCKYHQDKKFQLSSVASPILEMLCHFASPSNTGKDIHYILYAYFANNTSSIGMNDFIRFIKNTGDQEIILKYFHRIFIIKNKDILDIVNKARKSKVEKDKILDYYKTVKLCFHFDIKKFWKNFKYVKAQDFETLKTQTIAKLEPFAKTNQIAISLYYPNAISIISELATCPEQKKRTITKDVLLKRLEGERSIILTQWALQIANHQALLKTKKDSLSPLFSANTPCRAFIFSEDFIKANENFIHNFIHTYIQKYYTKTKLHTQAIFIFPRNQTSLVDTVIFSLHKYQNFVNNGIVGSQFDDDAFIKNTNCNPKFKCKITTDDNIDVNLLEKCQVTQLFWIGRSPIRLDSIYFQSELIDVSDINHLKYLTNLTTKLEVTTK